MHLDDEGYLWFIHVFVCVKQYSMFWSIQHELKEFQYKLNEISIK